MGMGTGQRAGAEGAALVGNQGRRQCWLWVEWGSRSSIVGHSIALLYICLAQSLSAAFSVSITYSFRAESPSKSKTMFLIILGQLTLNI